MMDELKKMKKKFDLQQESDKLMMEEIKDLKVEGKFWVFFSMVSE